MPSIAQPVLSVVGLAVSHPIAALIMGAVAAMLLARPGQNSYRA